MLVAVVYPLLPDQAVLHVKDDHALPLEVLSASVGGSLQQRDGVPVARHDVMKLQALRPAKGLAAAPEQIEDLLWSVIHAAEDVAADVMQRGVGRVQRGGLRMVGADGIEVAPDQVDGGMTARLHDEQATLYAAAPASVTEWSEEHAQAIRQLLR